MCSISSVPLFFRFVCASTVAITLCCVSTRHDVAENTYWFSVTFYLLLYSSVLWHLRENCIKFTNVGSAELACVSTRAHKNTVLLLAVERDIAICIPAYPSIFWLQLIDGRYKRNVCYHRDIQINRWKCAPSVSDLRQTVTERWRKKLRGLENE